MDTPHPRIPALQAALYALWDAGADATPADVTDDPDLLPLLEAAVERDQGVIAAALGKPAADVPPRGVAGRFAIGRLHGRGGMGEVYHAAEPDLGRAVAYKVLRRGLADVPAAAARFRREAELTASLQHPGVVPIYARVADDDGRPAYAMRFVTGPELGTWAGQRHAAVPPRPPTPAGWHDLLAVYAQLCGVIEFAHAAGVLHRDLTARNVLIDDADSPVVIDWGLARRAGDAADQAAPATTGGTPGFSAPELAGGPGRHSVASDVFALGAVLHVVLTGETPTAAGGLAPRPGLPRPLAAIRAKAMNREPADRYPSAAALAADVRAWLAGERVAADREPWRDTAARWAYRHRTPVLAAAAVLLAVAVGGTVAAVREADLRHRADESAEVARVAKAAADAARDSAVAEHARADAATDEMIAQAETVGSLQGTLPAVKQILDRGRQHLDRLAAAAAADPTRRDAAAAAHLRTGRIRFKLGQLPEAESACRAACDLTGPATEPVLRASALYQLGVVLAVRGKPKAAGPLWDDAAALLAGRPDLDRRGKLALARVYMARGNVAQFAGDAAASEGQYDLAAATVGMVLKSDPADADAEFLAAEVESNRGAARLRLSPGNPDRALAAHRVAAGYRRDLVDRFPANPDYKAYLAASHNHIGNALAARGGEALNAAVREYLASLELLEPLAVAFPGVPSHRQEIGMALHNLNVVLAGLGRWDDAVRTGRKAVDLLEGLSRALPDVADFHTELGVVSRSLAGSMRKAGHADEADELEYRAAVAYATAARAAATPNGRAASEDRALAVLAGLHDRGYFASTVMQDRAAREPAFAGLRSRPAFRAVMGGTD